MKPQAYELSRAERWFWVQTLLPPQPRRPYFEASFEEFLLVLPERPMGAAELACLAFHAGASAAFHGLAEHDRRCAKMCEEDALTDLQELALEPLEFLKRYGLKEG